MSKMSSTKKGSTSSTVFCGFSSSSASSLPWPSPSPSPCFSSSSFALSSPFSLASSSLAASAESSFFDSSSTFLFFSGRCRAGSRRSCCFARHIDSTLFHSSSCSLKRAPGCKSSMRWVNLRSSTQAFRYSAAFFSDCQTNLTSSKPSSLVGIEKSPKQRAKSFLAMSSVGSLGNHCAFSSAVSSTSSSAFLITCSKSSSGSLSS
mmetsp:Transcript_3015/g.6296  ORF Transcript_3015/g.6296 Transcript_3015/m.6296 type:complete len:205 (-) Transcript_3015:626-1240(-)